MAYDIKFNGKSLNADRSTTLRAWDRSEVNVLRVLTNETIHAVTTGDYRGLRAIFQHVSGRKAVFGTIRAIVKASTDKTFNIAIDDEGTLTMTIAAQEKRKFNAKVMDKLVSARDEAKVGIFNTAFLASLGIAASDGVKDFDLDKSAASLVKRAIKAGVDVSVVIDAIRKAHEAQTDGVVADTPMTEGLSAVA
jgi:hypothetical protein